MPNRNQDLRQASARRARAGAALSIQRRQDPQVTAR